MNNDTFVTRMAAIVNVYDLNDDNETYIEENFQETMNIALENIEEMGAEVMVINFTTQVASNKLVKTADIEYSLTEEQLAEAAPTKVPALGVGKKITKEVFEFIQEKSEEGLEPKEIAQLFDNDGQKISDFTVRKVLNTVAFKSYYSGK